MGLEVGKWKEKVEEVDVRHFGWGGGVGGRRRQVDEGGGVGWHFGWGWWGVEDGAIWGARSECVAGRGW